MRRPGRVILATFFAMLTLQTVGTIDAKHKLPAPKQFVAISVLWASLFLIADMGYAKAAARFSLLLLLAASVVGPFGQRLIDFVNMIASRFGGVNLATSPQTNPQTNPGSFTNPSVQQQTRTA